MIITGTMDAAVKADMLADGITVRDSYGRERAQAGAGIAAWPQRTMGLRIRETLGTEKADFKVKRTGERYLKLRPVQPGRP
jgi:hypothetical protein